MNRRSLALAIVASALISALVASLITMQWHWHHRSESAHHSQEPSAKDFHQWLHENLELTEEQETALRPIEEKFQKEQQRLRAEMLTAADALALEIRRKNRGAPGIDRALDQLNQSQATLQKLSLDHFFEMKSKLSAAQAEKLLSWTHDSIVGKHAQ